MVWNRILYLFLGLAVITAACSSSQSASNSTSLKGQHITLWTAEFQGLTDVMAASIPAFEQQTGISVDFQQFPQAGSGFDDKLALAQAAKQPAPDIYFGDVAFRATYKDRGAAEPLDSYLTDPAKTPASFNYADISPRLVALCKLNGATLCIPTVTSHTFMYYNKAILSQYGISTPPQTIQDMVQDADMATSRDHSGFCMVGSPAGANMFFGFMLSQYFLPYSDQNKGVILDANWHPLLNTPQALDWVTTYQHLMQKDAPRGVANYDQNDCSRDFEQGKVAIYLDSDYAALEVLDPTKSKVSSNVGFGLIPCPSFNPNNCVIAAANAWYINKYSTHKLAAWELIKWLLSKDVQSQIASAPIHFIDGVVRASVLSNFLSSGNYPPDLATADNYALSHLHPSPFPPVPELGDVVNAVSVMLSKIVSGQETPSQALKEANDAITATLTKGGEIKS